ncbi:MAG: DUF166 family protein [Anaerolineales bacterium]
MSVGLPGSWEGTFRLLALTQGLWGERIVANLRVESPDWEVNAWSAPPAMPLVVDDPDEFLPDTLPQVDLLLALGDTPGLVQLVPDAVRMSGAKAVLAPIDRETALPDGLAHQLKGWLADMGVPAVFPKPFCSLTQDSINFPPLVTTYDDPLIQRFAARFGRPQVEIEVADGRVSRVVIIRQAACGCTQSIAESLPGVPVADAPEAAALMHHHYPCLASMNIDRDYQDTLMHVSGNIVKKAFREGLGEHYRPGYVRPDGLTD